MFGALRPDTGSFSRLMVWLGLALVVLALVLPWLAFRETDALRISESELRGLTSNARASILDRQETARWVNEKSWVCFLLLIPGVVMVVLGGRGLRRQQSVDEQRARAEAQKAEHEAEATVVPQDERDREEALSADAIVEAPQQAVRADVTIEAPAAEATATAPEPTATTERDREAERRSARQRREELEERVLVRVGAVVPTGYSFQPEVKVFREAARLLLDGLMQAPQGQRDILVDIRVVTGFGAFQRLAIDQALANNVRYERITGREAVTWLIVILDEPLPEDAVRRLFGPGAGLVSDLVHVTTITSPEEITSAPAFGPPTR